MANLVPFNYNGSSSYGMNSYGMPNAPFSPMPNGSPFMPGGFMPAGCFGAPSYLPSCTSGFGQALPYGYQNGSGDQGESMMMSQIFGLFEKLLDQLISGSSKTPKACAQPEEDEDEPIHTNPNPPNYANKDISTRNLHGKDLSDGNFNKAIVGKWLGTAAGYQNADLTNTNCERTDFSNAKLNGVDFTGATLRDTNFAKANLNGVDFSKIPLEQLNSCNWEGAIFSGSTLFPDGFDPRRHGLVADTRNYD